jgi:dienelactone hydrolase
MPFGHNARISGPRWLRCACVLLLAVLAPLLQAQILSSRPNPANPRFPFDTPGPVKTPATAAQFDQWRTQIKSALFISNPLPTLAPKSYGMFSPTAGVIAERVTYGTHFGMRIPAIVYRPAHSEGKLPAMVVVDGHGGDKTSWYAFYTGILYARAGAVVVTYDPIGEDERNSERKSETREHDTVIKGPHSPERMGGLMVTDVMQAVSYLSQRPDVDARRIAVLGYSMGSFISAIAGAVDPRIRVLVLSGGGDLDGNMGSWDRSSKIMCQAGPYRALSFLPDKAAILYALHQRSGTTLILNGTVDPLVARPHHFKPFFADLNTRIAALTGTRANLPQSRFFTGVGHRPSWVTRPAALWLQEQLHFPNWTAAKINAMGTTHISAWAKATGAHINNGYAAEDREGGIRALGTGIPNVPWAVLQALPEARWQQEKERFTWDAWVQHALAADGIRGSDQKSFYPAGRS